MALRRKAGSGDCPTLGKQKQKVKACTFPKTQSNPDSIFGLSGI